MNQKLLSALLASKLAVQVSLLSLLVVCHRAVNIGHPFHIAERHSISTSPLHCYLKDRERLKGLQAMSLALPALMYFQSSF